MPRGIDLSPSTAILQAFEQGYRERLAREELAQRKLFQTESLRQRSEEAKARQKQAEAQLKATEEYRRSTLEQSRANLDFREAMEKARQTQAKAKLKLDFLTGYSKGETQFPASEYTGTGEEFDDPLKAIPESFSPFEGVTINRSELPRVYGEKEQQEDIFRRMEMSQREQDQRQTAALLASEERNQANIASREAIADKKSQDLLASIALRSELREKEIETKAKAGIPSASEVNQFVNGTRPAPPAGSKEWTKLSPAFADYEWNDYNNLHPEAPSPKGYSPLPQKIITDLQDSVNSKRAVEFAFEYAQALQDWMQGTNREKYDRKGGAFAEVVRLYRNVDKFIPHLRQGAALGVLSTYDLKLLRSNLPDITGEITERAFRNAIPKGELSWNMQRAVELGKTYKNRFDALTGNLVIGQKSHEWNKYKLSPQLRKEHQALLGER